MSGKVGAPYGNVNRVKPQLLYDALRKAAAQDNWARLRIGCDKVMDKFADGDPWAVAFVADRLDGKAAMTLKAEHDSDAPMIDPIEQVRLVALAMRLGMARLAEAATPVTIEAST